MLYKEFIPHPSLQQHIKCYWVFENSYGPNHFERMIPDGNIDFVFHYGQRPSLIINGKEIHKPADFLGGHLINAALLKFSGGLKMFGIKFYPWSSAVLYKMPAHELNNRRVPLEEIAGHWVKDYYSLLHNELNAGNYKTAILYLERELQGWLQNQVPNGTLKYCLEEIIQTGGDISVDVISHRLGFSARYIQKIFKEKKGMPFQYYCRLFRLQKALKDIKTIPADTLTGIAHAAGYYDQSHFIKDFTALTGLSPKKFIQEEHLYITRNIESQG